MKKYKRLIIASLIVGLSTQLYIDFYTTNLKFSFGAVVFPFILFIYDEFHPIVFSITSGISLLLFRGLFYGLFQGILSETLCYNAPEFIFYLVYGIILYIFMKKRGSVNQNLMFVFCLISDFASNIVEMYVRAGNNSFIKDDNTIKIFILVAFVRASIVWIIIMGYKYYKLLLVKEEHDRRYKELLLLISKLKTEVYWMEKNMDHIEKVMSNAYSLFNNITNGIKKDRWAQDALDIAKDVHEIKKEYSTVVMGIEEIVADRMDATGMYFSELISILKESIEREIKNQGKDIRVQYHIGKDFYTEKHYYLMSILRNLMANAIDSIDKKGNIILAHNLEGDMHVFKVIDDGSGIEEEDLPHIFSPGYSTKIDYGTGQVYRGLGLTLINNILQVHIKGNIEVASKLGKGTTFIIHIPSMELEGINS